MFLYCPYCYSNCYIIRPQKSLALGMLGDLQIVFCGHLWYPEVEGQ